MANATAPSLSVLLVDDEVSYVDVLARRLSKRGIEACPATSGQQAIQILRTRDFDVAVIDLKMERMDGLELLKVLKKLVPEMQVIILSGHGGEAEARQSILAGAYDYIVKPCELTDLVEKIIKAANAGRPAL